MADGQPRAASGTLSGRVLVVDDSPENLLMLGMRLEAEGLTIERASNGLQGVAMASRAPFDLILMDRIMPGLDGREATRRLREAGFAAPIILMTGAAIEDERAASLEAGASAFLSKPINPNLLVAMLRTFLEKDAGAGPDDAPSASDVSRYVSIVRDYVAQLPARVEQIRAAAARNDLSSALSGAHKIRGSAALYGFPYVTETAGLIESAILEGQAPEIIEDLIRELTTLAGEIVLNHSPEPSP